MTNRRFHSGARRAFLSFLLLLGVCSSLAFAQLPSATVLGTVKDSTGAVVPDAAVTARSLETGATRTAKSGANGSYRFSAMPVGTYEVRAERAGFRAAVRGGVTLTVGQEAVVNFAMEVGAIEQTIEVSAEAPLVNTTSGALGDLVNEQQVATLPLNGRNYAQLTLMEPGVQENRNARTSTSSPGVWFSANGAPTRSNYFLLDGTPIGNDTNGTTGGATGATLGVEGIREWKMVTNSVSAEYGMRMGSQMMIATKGGTNNLHGSVFEFLRNSALDARNFFDYPTEVTTSRLPPFRQNQFGGSVGGPIRHDKLFYFATYEGLRQRTGKTIIDQVIPKEAKVEGNVVPQIAPAIKPLLALFPDPNLAGNRFTYPATSRATENFGQARVDYNITAKDMAFSRFTLDRGDNVEPQAFPQFIQLRTTNQYFLTAADNHIFSPALLGTFRFSFSRSDILVDSPHDALSGPQYSLVPGRALPIITVAGFTTLGPSQNSPSIHWQDVYSGSGDMFRTMGRHSLKFGMLFNEFAVVNNNGNQYFGTLSFTDLTAFLLGRPQVVQAQSPDNVRTRNYRWQTFGFYLQDDLRATSRLTLNLGLRYEFHTTFKEIDNHGSALRDVQRDAEFTIGPTFLNPSRKNFSPRIGFAWDVRGDGKMSVRGGVAILYDIGAHGSSFGNLPSAQPPFSTQSQVRNLTSFALPFAFPESAKGKAVRTMQYHLNEPHMIPYNLTVERQLPLGISLSLGYAGSRGFNLMKSIEGNPTIPQILSGGRFFWLGTEPRVNNNWTTIQYHTSSSNSWYNSLQFVLRKNMAHGLQFQSSYTWGKLLDEAQSQSNIDNGGGYHPWLRSRDKGPAVFNATHAWRFNSIYRVPEMPLHGLPGKMLNGWLMSGILTMQTGFPFETVMSSNRSRSQGANDKPDRILGRGNDNIVLGGPDRYFDPTAFSLPAAGFLGNAGRNYLVGPGTFNLDFSLVKDTGLKTIGEAGKLEFRAEFFNILNRANFGLPNATVFTGSGANPGAALATAGQITSTDNPARQIQLALKIIW